MTANEKHFVKNLLMPRLHKCIITLLILMLGGCSSNDQLPPQVTVGIMPDSFEWQVRDLLDENGDCIFFEDDYQDNVFNIAVRNTDSQPVGEADIDVYLSPSNSTSTPLLEDQYAFYLYDDSNNNGRVDHPQELVSGSNDEILYSTTTDEYTGTKSVIVRTNTSCSGLRATLTAFAGDGFGQATVSTVPQE